jgi:hypothetical protein
MAIELSSAEERELSFGSRRRAADTAWVLLLLDGLLIGCASLYWLFQGRFFDTGFYEAVVGGPLGVDGTVPSPRLQVIAAAGVRLAGFLGVIASVFIVAVAATSYRRGERWAWYAMWTLPLLATLDFSLIAGYGALSPTAVVFDGAVLVLSLAALISSNGVFFRDRD